MPNRVIVCFCGVAHETMAAVGRLVGGCVSGGIVVRGVDWVQYPLTCDVVAGSSSFVGVPPLLDGANRWTLPRVHIIITSVHVWNAVGEGFPFEDGERYGDRRDSYVDLL